MTVAFSLQASLDRGEAVLRFPYHDGLRRLLRAIPGRRWDPEGRVWRIPLDPERAEAVARLMCVMPGASVVSEELAQQLRRLRAKRGGVECVLDLARPDEEWWLSFATDRAPETVESLLTHPGAYRLPAIARALAPLDADALRLVEDLEGRGGLRLTEDATHALTELGRRDAAASAPDPELPVRGVELLRDRLGRRWVVIAAEHAPLARRLAGERGLRARDAQGGRVAIAATDPDAIEIAALLEALHAADVEERVGAWLRRATAWRGTIEVGGQPGEPMFLLLGESSRLPAQLREHGVSIPGGVAVPLTVESWRLLESLPANTRSSARLSAAARRCVDALQQGRPAPPSVLQLSEVHDHPAFVLAPGHADGHLAAFAALPGALPPSAGGRRSEQERLPAIHADPFCVPELDAFIEEHEAWVEPAALELLQEIREEHARACGIVALSEAGDGELEVPGLGGELKPFQRAGVSYLLARRRSLLADEQGLGKTIQALAAVEADGAYPAIVVCPASLKLVWAREIARWLPRRTAEVLSGTTGQLARAQITVLNYDIVGARLEQLIGLRAQALVLDEAHYCKNGAAKRTQAMQRLGQALPAGGLALALTGTPVMNRPSELVSQLRIIGRLGDFGSGVQFSKRFRGPDAHLRLHWHLRARCFVRRLKADVLPQLPAKTRTIVPVALDNEPEYRLAERDLIAWLRSQPLDLQELDAKVAAALRAERLVRLNALKMLAAEGKLHAALSWIHDFLASGERLVVFARHRRIQRAVVERFPRALHILGEDGPAARDAAVRSFQDPDSDANQLLVCSMELAGHGLTLTRASNVAFLELDWTPAKHDQAEDRCHRIGQQDAVNATYLLAAETVDETIATLLERKRAIIGAVTDGREQDGEAVIDALVRELRGAPYRHLRAVA